MEIPTRLYRLPDGTVTDALAPGQSGRLICAAGTWLPEDEAQRLGITPFLARRAAAQVKAVEPSEVEDKAVDPSETENKGVEPSSPSPEGRRVPGRSVRGS